MKKKGQANAMILLGVGVILLVVVLGVIFTFIRDNALEIQTIVNETITISSTSNSVVNETLTITSGIGYTGNSSITTVTFFGNTTNNTASGIALGTSVNWTRSGSVTIDQDMFNDDDYNITYTYSTDATGTTAEDDVNDVTYFGNTTIHMESSIISIDIEVNFTDTGTITVSAVNFTDDNYNITYSHEPDAYLSAGTSRTLVSTIPILLVVLIFLFVAGFLVLKKG